MPVKTRRLEIRVDQHLLDRINALLDGIAIYDRKPAISEFVRLAIENELEYAEPAVARAINAHEATAQRNQLSNRSRPCGPAGSRREPGP